MPRQPSGPAAAKEPRRRRPPAEAGGRIDQAAARLEGFGLTHNEARVLAALVSVGSASATELARLSKVHRTGVYPVLEDLNAKGLADQLPGRSATWDSPGPDEVVKRLRLAHEERLRAIESSIEPTRQLLKEIATEHEPLGESSIQFVRGAGRVDAVYRRLLESAGSEVLVFNRPPYGITTQRPSDTVLELLGRGVVARVVYLASLMEHAGMREESGVYVRAGLQARMADDVPVKLAIVDRRVVMFGTGDAVFRAKPFPPNVVVDDRGFAAAMVATFEHWWATARPLPFAHAADARGSADPMIDLRADAKTDRKRTKR